MKVVYAKVSSLLTMATRIIATFKKRNVLKVFKRLPKTAGGIELKKRILQTRSNLNKEKQKNVENMTIKTFPSGWLARFLSKKSPKEYLFRFTQKLLWISKTTYEWLIWIKSKYNFTQLHKTCRMCPKQYGKIQSNNLLGRLGLNTLLSGEQFSESFRKPSRGTH